MVVQAMRVIRERLNDVAVGDGSFVAVLDHATQFAPKALQPDDPALDIRQVTSCNRIRPFARTLRVVRKV